MKSNIAIIFTILVLFVIAFRFGGEVEKRQLISDSSVQDELQNQKKLRKVSYGEGEFEKVKIKWEKELQILFIDISKNMQIGIEQITIHNFVLYSKKFEDIKTEIENIDPPLASKKIYSNFWKEVLAGRNLCQSYITNYKQFDYLFKIYYLIHYQNTIYPGT